MMKEHEPDSGYNLPPGLHEDHPYFNAETRDCSTCRHCIEECCDMGLCERKLNTFMPRDFESWAEVMNYLDGCRVDMQEDYCSRWEEER